MIFKRKIYDKLKAWKDESQGSTALLIEGARRIGKSTIAEQFGKNEYKTFINVSFDNIDQDIINAFNNCQNDLDDFFLILESKYGHKLYRRESLVIFDEIQLFPKARQFIKKLVLDGRFDYIETGSLISIKENVKDILLPSEEKSMKMYPMSFEEFCWAFGNETLVDYIKKCCINKVPLAEGLHQKAMLLFKQYLLVGGMPKVVDTFLSHDRDFNLADAQKRLILDLYRNDISKADAKYKSKVKSIFDQLPSFLSKHEKRVRLSNLDHGNSYPSYQETFFWLSDSMMTNECYLSTDPNVGLALNEDRSWLKCYMGDTGLLVSLAFNEKELAVGQLYKDILFGSLSISQGMFYENGIAQILVSSGHDLFFYSHYSPEKKRNDMEIDFILSNKSVLKPKIFPIEVKSTNRYDSKSIVEFTKKYKKRIGASYIVHPKNLKIGEEGIVYLPCYMAMCL